MLIISNRLSDTQMALSSAGQNAIFGSNEVTLSKNYLDYDLNSYHYFRNGNNGLKRYLIKFRYTKKDTINARLYLGNISANPNYQDNGGLEIRNVGDEVYFYIRRDGVLNSITLLGATTLAINDFVDIEWKVWDNVAYLQMYVGDTLRVFKSGTIGHNTGRIAICCELGTHSVSNFEFYSLYDERIAVFTYGDSITNNNISYRQELAKRLEVATCSGVGDKTIEIVDSISTSNTTRRNINLVLIGSNDAAGNVFISTFADNIDYIYRALNATAPTYFCEILPRNGVNVLTYNQRIYQKIPIDRIIPIYKLMEDPSNAGDINPAYSSDAIHPNQAGSTFLANFLYNYIIDNNLLS